MVNGYYLNNELTDFNFVPVGRQWLPVANRVEAGKRPRSSMSPTIVFSPDGRVRLAVGAAGGATIIAQVAKAIIGVVDWRLSAQEAIALPVLYSPGRHVYVEKGTRARSDDPRAHRARPQGRGARAGLQGQCDRMEWTAAGSARPIRAAKARASENKMASRSHQQLEHFPNLVTMFLTRAREKGDKPFLSAKRDGAWQSISYAEAARQVAALADSLKRLGLKPGDRVMLVSENRPEWLIADLGDHGRGLRHGADLHHQHDARSPAYPQQFGRRGGHRLDPETGARTDARGAVRVGLPPHHLDRRHHHRPVARRRAIPSLGRPRRGRERHRRARSARWPTSGAATSPA